jgi:hypothetical protein
MAMSATSLTTRLQFIYRVPARGEAVNVRPAHAEFGGDISHRRLVVADAAKVFLRYLQDARTHLVGIRRLRTG